MKPAQAAVLDGIVRSAATAFGELGYRAATLDAIAERAGLSKVTLYRYVSSKEELLSLVVERTIDEFQQGLRRIIAEHRPADDTLRRIIRYQVTLLAEICPLTVFFSEEGGLPPHGRPLGPGRASTTRPSSGWCARASRPGCSAICPQLVAACSACATGCTSGIDPTAAQRRGDRRRVRGPPRARLPVVGARRSPRRRHAVPHRGPARATRDGARRSAVPSRAATQVGESHTARRCERGLAARGAGSRSPSRSSD